MREIRIPDELYKKVEERALRLGFSVDEYVAFVLEEMVKEEGEKFEEEEEIKRRLRDLGYIDLE